MPLIIENPKRLLIASTLIVGALCLSLGVFIGVGISGGFKALPEAITVAKITADRNKEEILNAPPPQASIKKAAGNKAAYTINFETPYYGNIGINGMIDLRPFEKKHAIGIGAVLINTQMLARINYQYKNWDFALYAGYDFGRERSGYKIGAGISYYFRF